MDLPESKITKATLYVVRHGECQGNVSDDFLDPFTDALTEVGKAQAERLGSHLKTIPFTGAYSSDYLRAEQTARIVLTELGASCPSEIDLVTDKRLRERDISGMIGEPTAVSWVQMASSMEPGKTDSNSEVPSCETAEQFETRIISFFSEIIKGLPESLNVDQHHILIVSHGLVIQRLMCLLNSRSNDFGLDQWVGNLFSERPINNARYHQITLDISRVSSDNENESGKESAEAKISGKLECVHYKDHLDSNFDEDSNENEEAFV